MEVTDDAGVADADDRRRRVVVDRDDRLGLLHPCPVCEGPGDPARHVETRPDLLPRLADLAGMGIPASVRDRQRYPDDAAEGLGQLLEQAHALPIADAAPARDDDRRAREPGGVAGTAGGPADDADRASIRPGRPGWRPPVNHAMTLDLDRIMRAESEDGDP